jgi:hypothetical protein
MNADLRIERSIEMVKQPRAGEALFAEWGGTWYEAEILAVNDDGTARIHYTGWGEEYDETVTCERLSREQPAAAAATPNANPQPLYWDSLERLLLGEPVSADTRLQAGAAIHVKWQTSWWAAEVVTPNADGTVKIHYTGWGSNWDEVVSRERIQLPSRGDKIVTFHLERGWSVTGKVLEVLADCFVFNRVEDHRVCVIRREQVRYLELHSAPRDYVQSIRSM